MPKGGDLHNHLSGTPYAEDFLDWAAAKGYCADRQTGALRAPPCAAADSLSRIASESPYIYARIVDHHSTRGWQQGIDVNEVSGHTQFFITFDRLGVIEGRDLVPGMMAVTLRTIAGDNAAYLELMHNPREMMAWVMAGSAGQLDEAGLEARLESELPGLAVELQRARAQLDADEAEVQALLGCGTDRAESACGLKVNYLASAMRALPPGQVFRSLLMGFALADADPRYVGVNIVMPEDWPVALRDYDLHMAMFRVLKQRYPGVNITMHAGELAQGLVPPRHLKDHIAKAISSGAQRIGHGVGIANETEAETTLRHMASERIPVEINLSSNAVILGVEGNEHPLALYRRYGVPVMLSTDDLGILRTDLTTEYVRAVRDQDLEYADLVKLSRASLEYAFIAGESLWRDGVMGRRVDACRTSLEAAACRSFLQANEKAGLQAEYEVRLRAFEEAIVNFPE